MNKADKLFIMIVAICACLLYVPLVWSAYRDAGRDKEVVVSYKDREILRKSLALNDVYTVKGTLGDVQVEVKDKRVRVEKENSPYHLCSFQGWVEDANRPIVCLPNNIVVQIEASDTDSDDVDTVIQ
ncbi:NusG domain II-containing protein [[Clostridium] innocuum]|nr:NusG domain II-containing protein [[Clostridium] innocuum]